MLDPDPVTGHWPHWVAVDESNPGDKWFVAAMRNSVNLNPSDGTYEAIGPHFQGNPYNLTEDKLVKHGELVVTVKRDFESISDWLNQHCVEGLVFWLDATQSAKLREPTLAWNGLLEARRYERKDIIRETK